MKHPVLTLRRAELVAARACKEWIDFFDEIRALRGDDSAPLVRRGGVSRRDPQRLRIELTPLAQLWMARDARGAVLWLRERGVLGPVYAPRVQAPGVDLLGAGLSGANLGGADLSGANLRGADLSDAILCGANLRGADLRLANLGGADLCVANLRGANLSDANLYGADLSDANLGGADLSGANLRRAHLSGANLRGANLRGALRRLEDPSVPGWNLREGVLSKK